jgi:hypothetical protein
MFLPSQAGTVSATITITTDNPAFEDIQIPITAVVEGSANEDNTSSTPVMNRLLGSGPNPFRLETSIFYRLDKNANAELMVYNTKGARVFSTPLSSRNTSVSWNGLDNAGNTCPAGLYVSALVMNGKVVSAQKIVRLK